MGNFNHKCNFSQLPARYKDRIVVMIGVRNTDIDADIFAPGKSFVPVSVPIRGEYNDYGGIMNVDRTPGIDALEKFFGMDVERAVECAERVSSGCKEQVSSDYKKIKDALSTGSVCIERKNELSYIMEHESVFDDLLFMSDCPVKDVVYWKIPHDCLEELGYSRKSSGTDDSDDEFTVWTHPSLPELKESSYVWKTEDYGDYGKVCQSISELCEYIGCEVPEKYCEPYLETRFDADVEIIGKMQDVCSMFSNYSMISSYPSDSEYSFMRHAPYGLFSVENCRGALSKHLLCSLGTGNSHINPEFKKEVIEVALLYKALQSLQMTWNCTSYYSQEIDYKKHIRFLENCLEVAKRKDIEYDCDD